MLCARIIAGVGTGGISAVIPVWGSGEFRSQLSIFDLLVVVD